MPNFPRISRLETPIFYYRRVYTRRNCVRARVIAALKPALRFLRAVRRAGKKQELERLLTNFRMQNCDEVLLPDLIDNVKQLLEEHRRLLVMFNALLPEDLKFQIPDEAGSDSSEIDQENN